MPSRVEYAWSNLSDVEGSTVRHYANSSENDLFEGLDLLPERPGSFFHDSPYRRGLANTHPALSVAPTPKADA